MNNLSVLFNKKTMSVKQPSQRKTILFPHLSKNNTCEQEFSNQYKMNFMIWQCSKHEIMVNSNPLMWMFNSNPLMWRPEYMYKARAPIIADRIKKQVDIYICNLSVIF